MERPKKFGCGKMNEKDDILNWNYKKRLVPKKCEVCGKKHLWKEIEEEDVGK